MLHLFVFASVVSSMILEAVIAGFVIAFLSYVARFLTTSGAVATFFLAVPIYGLGGWRFTVPILAFFISSSLFSRLKASARRGLTDIFAKPSRRDAGQVMANGGVATVLVLLWYFQADERYYLAYLGSLSAVTSDTWSTELGVLSKKEPRLITDFARVERGTSGAISSLGTFAGLLGSAMIYLSAVYWLRGIQPDLVSKSFAFFTVTLSGLFGNLSDSFLGATLQAQYRCLSCGKVTERKVHCPGSSSLVVRGKNWITNDLVNFLCSSVGGTIGLGAAGFWQAII